MKYVNFVSDQVFEELCVSIFKKYKIKRDIFKNLVDPVKLMFDLHGHGITIDKWKQTEHMRQADKSINNDIGYFHQKLLGKVNGWINLDESELSSRYPVDLCNEDMTIFIELKNKHNTMNSSSKRDVKNRLQKIKKENPDAACFIGILIGEPPKKKNTSILYGSEIYSIVTGDPCALSKTLTALDKCLRSISKSDYSPTKFYNKCAQDSFNIPKLKLDSTVKTPFGRRFFRQKFPVSRYKCAKSFSRKVLFSQNKHIRFHKMKLRTI
jgi:hypothetical protein